jgi:DNA-binding NtrC family response regulator
MNERILVAEDEEILRVNLCEFLGNSGYEVDGAANGEEALERVLEDDYAVVIADIRMPRMDGIALLKRIVTERPETSVLITTAYASVDSAVEALRHGAHDYLLKPVVFEDLLQKIRNLTSYRALRDEVGRLRLSIQTRLGFEGIVGDSPGIRKVFDLIEKVAPNPSTVLITGESGTGKELVARAVHQNSQVANREFLAVNVAAIPADLVESQLFGHEKGAFTGAHRRREGLLRTARGGTVFLDEVAELPPSAQVKLLRAIESKEILPVGGDKPQTAEFRLLAATNQDLEARIEQGSFRQDLYFRLNVFRIEVPPLRERREDIPALANHFLELHGKSLGKHLIGVNNQAMRMLMDADWPGNVRELSNVIERGILLAEGEWLTIHELPAGICEEKPGPLEFKQALSEFERQHISRVLAKTSGDKQEAARLLGVHLATLYRRMEKLGLS